MNLGFAALVAKSNHLDVAPVEKSNCLDIAASKTKSYCLDIEALMAKLNHLVVAPVAESHRLHCSSGGQVKPSNVAALAA